MYLLDTDHLSLWQMRHDVPASPLIQRLSGIDPGLVFVSVISFHEQALGWNTFLSRAKSMDDVIKGYGRFMRMLGEFAGSHVLPFTREAADRFLTLRKKAVRIATMDLRIACIALSLGLTLLTRNVRDFRQVPDLQVEDWTLPL